jgi:hypothetical protein
LQAQIRVRRNPFASGYCVGAKPFSTTDAVLDLMPDEERIRYSAMTGQSLFYLARRTSNTGFWRLPKMTAYDRQRMR